MAQKGAMMLVVMTLLLLVVAFLMAGGTDALKNNKCPVHCRCLSMLMKGQNKNVLNCSRNDLVEVPMINSVDHEVIDLSHNRLGGQFDLRVGAISDLDILVILDLSYNSIVNFSGEFLVGLSSLQYLDLKNNSISNVPPNLLQSCPTIQGLSLSNNPRFGNGLAWYRKVNNLSESDAFLVAPSLRSLHLAGCNLNLFPPWMVSGLPGLEMLDLAHNKLTTISLMTLASACRLSSIFIGENLWDCDSCEMQKVQKWLTIHTVEVQNDGRKNICQILEYGKSCNLSTSVGEINARRKKCLSEDVPQPELFSGRLTWRHIGLVMFCVLILCVAVSAVVDYLLGSVCLKKNRNKPTVYSDVHRFELGSKEKEALNPEFTEI